MNEKKKQQIMLGMPEEDASPVTHSSTNAPPPKKEKTAMEKAVVDVGK